MVSNETGKAEFEEASNAWEPCEAGFLAGLNAESIRQKKTRSLQKLAAVSAVAAVLIVAAMFAMPDVANSTTDSTQVHLVCNDILKMQDDFFAGRLSSEDSAQVRKHIAYCLACRVAYRRKAKELGVDPETLVASAKPAANPQDSLVKMLASR